MFSQQELQRYNRHILLPEIGFIGQQKLKQAKVLVIGAGGLGCPILQYLTAVGVGTIGIIDDDAVSISNLQRQILFSEEDLGKPKVEVAKQKLQKQNPHVTITAHKEQLTTNNQQLIKEYDIIVDGTDNFPSRYLINDVCVLYNKPLVFGSIFKFEGQISVFNYKNGPTYRCLFPEPPNADEVPNCSEIGVLGILPGIIGILQANEVIKIITEIGKPLSGKLFIINTLSFASQTIKFERNEKAMDDFRKQNPDISKINYESFCNSSNQLKWADGMIKSITVEELKEKKINKEIFQLIDVRNQDEFEKENIGGVLMPLSTIENNIEKINRDIPVVVHCQSGKRSERAIQLLQDKYRFTNLLNLKGGIMAWLNER